MSTRTIIRHGTPRDRATDPQLGDQTACKHCGFDIEYNDGWHDRGGETHCPSYPPTRVAHEPVSDGTSRTLAPPEPGMAYYLATDSDCPRVTP